jgi:hypothetical protein
MGGRSFEHQRSLSERLMEEPGPLASPERTACAAGLDAVPHLLGALHALGPSGGLPDAELVDSTPSFLVRSIRGEPAGRSLDPDTAAVRDPATPAAGVMPPLGRTVEIQKADAIRLAGAQAVWKDLGQRLLDDTCQVRTGRHEEDGCWPSFE